MPVPQPPPLEPIAYHWSSSTNRRSILKLGLVPGRKTIQGTDFRPPYVCLAPDPMMAWQLSGRMFDEVESWDLWCCDLDRIDLHRELLLDTFIDTGRHYLKEYRVYGRIYKRYLHYVATRRAD